MLINTGRGALVDEEALCEALDRGHLFGAGLDVFKTEPLPLDSPLLKYDNVLLCTHMGGLDCGIASRRQQPRRPVHRRSLSRQVARGVRGQSGVAGSVQVVRLQVSGREIESTDGLRPPVLET